MTKNELISAVAEQTGLTKKDVDLTVNTVLDTIIDTLSEREKVSFVGFGSFDTRDRSERKGRNPQTKEEIIIPATTVPVFRAGKTLRDAVAGK